MTQYYLMVYTANCTDEFNVHGFQVFEVETWHCLNNQVKEAFRTKKITELVHSFGSNQSIEFSNYERWRECYRATEITQEERIFLDRMSRLCSSFEGTFFYPREVFEDDEEDE